MLGSAALAQSSYHSMYGRLGGYAGVRAIAGDLVQRLSADPELAHFFTDIPAAQRRRLAAYAAEFACKEAGAGCTPRLPDIALVRTPPSLNQAQENAAIADVRATLESHRVPSDIQGVILRSVR